MNTKMKTICAAGLLCGSLFVTNSALAQAVFPDIEVTEGAVPGTTTNTFTADKIIGNYVEIATFTAATAVTGSFDVSIQWSATSFVADDGTTAVSSFLNSPEPAGYAMYALYTASGTYVIDPTGGTNGNPLTTFTFGAGGGLTLAIDANGDTTFIQPATGDLPWTLGGTTTDDETVVVGVTVEGQGTLDPGLSTCGVNVPINCGSFGTTTALSPLTAFGQTYFTQPVPFYEVAFEAGQLNNFEVSGTQEINGSLDVVFARVPEPTTLALLSLGLLGLGGMRRRSLTK